LKTLIELYQTLRDPTIIFCSSPKSAAEVAQALIPSVALSKFIATDAANWVADNYHPDWHFVRGLRKGVGIYHGRIPRALAHYAVAAFNSGVIRFLVCASTLIDEVNIKDKNVIIYGDKINGRGVDFLPFHSGKVRSGGMGQHYIGHVQLFNRASSNPLPFAGIPVLSEPENTSPSLLRRNDDEDLTTRSKKKVEAFLKQELVDYETLRSNVGIDPQGQIEIAKEISGNLEKYVPMLKWRRMPNHAQLFGICDLIWKPFRCSRFGAGSAVNAKQLGSKLIRLHDAPSTRVLIQEAFACCHDADEAVQQVLDFLNLWANFHFPQLLRALDRVQKDVLQKFGLRSGDYGEYAAKVENRFMAPSLVGLEEYGVPLEVALKLHRYLRPYSTVDDALANLRHLPLEKMNLSGFERAVVEDAQKRL